MKHVIKMWKQSYYSQQLHVMSNDEGTVRKLLVVEWEAEPWEQEPKEQNWKKKRKEKKWGWWRKSLICKENEDTK